MTARHGTRRRYQTGCRCNHCGWAESTYKDAWRRGGRARFPADPVRDHVRTLLDSGWTAMGLTRAATLGTSTVWDLMHGGRDSVNSRTAQALLNLKPLTPEGIASHLRTLIASGLTAAEIAAEAGVQVDTVTAHLTGERHEVRQGTAERLAAVESLPEPVVLDAGPLLAAVAGRRLDDVDRQALTRARRTGRIDLHIADRIAIAAGLGPLVLIYPHDDEVAA